MPWTSTSARARHRSSVPVWEGLGTLVDSAIAHAGDPDQGIWEIRGDPEHFTASKVLCWVAMDRGADMAHIRGDKSGRRRGARQPTS